MISKSSMAKAILSKLQIQLQKCKSLQHLTQVQALFLRLNLIHHPTYLFISNKMLRLFISNNQMHYAIKLYYQMRLLGLSPNNFTYPFVLKACTRLQDVKNGKLIHTHLLKSGFEVNMFIKTGLLSFYAKCGFLNHASKLFDGMSDKSVVSWTAMIRGYLDSGMFSEGVDLFKKMLNMGLIPDSFMIVMILTACSKTGDMQTGEWIHDYVIYKRMDKDVFISTSLVDLYMKYGHMDKARFVFDRMQEKDIVTWSIMINGYSTNGLPNEALQLFFQMEKENLKPDCFTMVAILSACARLGALGLGEKVSRVMSMHEFLSNAVLGTALIDMYSKCGRSDKAWNVFKEMKERDVVVWNAMINGLVMTGYHNIAFALFAQMEKKQIKPEANTFVGLICGCTHAGLVEDGQRYFKGMNQIYGLSPKVEHYGCIVDLLARAGLLEEAYEVIRRMPMEANAVVWGALLGGCRLYKDINLAERVLRKLIEIEPKNSANYVLLSNVYAKTKKWEESAELRLLMKDKGLKKTPGSSWLELNGTVHEFHVGDKSHPLAKQIYLKLEELSKRLKDMGFRPTIEEVLFDIEEEEKEHFLGYHSEKIAIAFGLISTGCDETIRIVKNLRVCNDCHAAIKIISEITKREILVRDTNRFHCFKDGSCSCNDYW